MKHFFVAVVVVLSMPVKAQYLYGTTSGGGANGTGTIFRTKLDGTNLTTEYDFAASVSPGIRPSRSQLLEIGGKLYGTTTDGGLFSAGVLFEYNLATGAYVVKKDFESLGRGRVPDGQLVYANGKIYGTTVQGGTHDAGIIWSYDIATDALAKHVEFSSGNAGPTGLTAATNGKLYGLTRNTATSHGTIFEFDPNNGGYSQKFSFDGTTTGDVNSTDGLTLAANGKLYGTTLLGGLNNGGTLFEFDPTSGTYTKKLDFDSQAAVTPIGPLFLASNNLIYGWAAVAGMPNYFAFHYDPATDGFVKTINTTTFGAPIMGTQLPNGLIYFTSSEGNPDVIMEFDPATDTWVALPNFNRFSDGGLPHAVMLASNGKMYGTTAIGGIAGRGTLFEFDRNAGPNGTITSKVTFNMAANGFGPTNSLAVGPNGKLYGSANGGTNGQGLIFEFDPVSKAFAVKVQFSLSPTSGSALANAMTLAGDGNFYGITSAGGAQGKGIVFQFNPVTGAFVKKRDLQNLDGSNAIERFVPGVGNRMYTTTLFGGVNGAGTLLEYQWDADGLAKLHDFDFTSGLPLGALTLTANGTLLGKTSSGSNSKGTIFEFNPVGNVYTTKVNFDGTYGSGPVGRLLPASNGKMYAMTNTGGANEQGVVYEYDYSNNTPAKKGDFDISIGAQSQGDLIEGIPGKLYGLMPYGGILNAGTLIEYDVATGSITRKQDFLGANGVRPMNGSMVLVNLAPQITSISPLSGVLGTIVTIKGTHFDPQATNNYVRFGSVESPVISATTSEITVAVPSGFSIEPISVTTGGMTAVSSNTFDVTFRTRSVYDANALQESVSINLSQPPVTIDVGDFDRDGKTDIVYGTQSTGEVGILRNTTPDRERTMTFAPNPSVSAGPSLSYVYVRVADIDGDAKQDLIVSNNYSNYFSVFINTSTLGTISFATRVDFPFTSPGRAAVGDLDHDGKPDLVIPNLSNNDILVYKNIAAAGSFNTGSLMSPVILAAGALSQTVTIADLDGDGWQDILVGTAGNVAIIQNNGVSNVIGTGSFSTPVILSGSYGANSIAAGDLNVDGKLDVVIANNAATKLTVLKNIGTPGPITIGSFTPFDVAIPGAIARKVAVYDFDGDGRPDIGDLDTRSTIFRNTGTGDVSSGTFTPVGLFQGGVDIAFADFNGDGKVEPASTDNGFRNVSVLRNGITALPTITSFSPATAVAGTVVTIIGTNFDVPPGNVKVLFPFGTEAEVISNTGTELKVKVPPGLLFAGKIGVQVNYEEAITATNFTPIPPPQISSVSPLSGEVGKTVFIGGSNFSPTSTDNIVKFNGTLATVTSSAASTLVTTVPAGATTGPITVTVGSQTGTSASSFTVILTTGDLLQQPNDAILIYPNPSRDELIVDLGCFEKGASVELSIVDLAGRRMEHRLTIGGTRMTIDVRHLPIGNFILKAGDRNKSYSSQFAKQ